MDYLLPAWHDQLIDWAFSRPQMQFDDAVSHFRLFKQKQRKLGLIITDYLPQLTTQLSQLAIWPDRLYSVFDYLQGINTTAQQVLGYQDFNWPKNAYFDFTNFRAFVMVNNELYAKIIFDTQSKILAIEYIKQGQLNYRLVLDSRGFVSRKEQGDVFTYYDQQGYWRFEHNQKTGEVVVNPLLPAFCQKQRYHSLDELVHEIIVEQIFPQLTKHDNLIVTLDEHQQLLSGLPQTNLIYSASKWHQFNSTDLLKNVPIVVDTDETANQFKGQVQHNLIYTIPLFQSEIRLGHSQRTSKQHIALFAENIKYEELTKLVETIYQRLLKHSQSETLTIYSYRFEQNDLANQVIQELQQRHAKDFKLASKHVQLKDADLEEDQRPTLEITAECLTSTADVLSAFDKVRLLIDYGLPDQFIKMAAVSIGIPQLVDQSSKELSNGQNGIICHNEQDLAAGLAYYLDHLENWNKALVYNVKMLNHYAADNLFQKWQQILVR